jgi:hypothetical protein
MRRGDGAISSPQALRRSGRLLRLAASALIAIAAPVVTPSASHADEGGISFWLPGLFGSFAAAPGHPGWSVATIYYHSTVSAGSGTTFLRGGHFDVGLDGHANLLAYGPTYTFATPVLGGQAAISLLNVAGNNAASVSGALTGPLGRTISGTSSDSTTAFGDLLPQASLKWNQGVNNYMIYATGDIPVGSYNPARLTNLGIGHGAIDGGAGYTYLNPATGIELSAVAGLTYNFENPDTHYQNGVDGHIDWAASLFLNKQVHAGAVGYFYQQLTGDSGSGATLGSFESRVAGIGPEVGYFFPVGDKLAGYVNAKVYKEFAAQNRPDGWNAWLTLQISEASPHAPGT